MRVHSTPLSAQSALVSTINTCLHRHKRPKHGKCVSACAATQQPESITVVFTDSQSGTTTTQAKPGENIYEVATNCGVSFITVGCCNGNCGICEIEVKKYEQGSDETEAIIVRSCITSIPPGYSRIEITELFDTAWGVDGYDT